MSIAFSIAAGGAAGALSRYWVSVLMARLLGTGFPFGTLVVNVVGSVLMGFLYTTLGERLAVSDEVRFGLLVGVLGAFTTFSTFSMETVGLITSGQLGKSLVYVVSSVALCVAGCWGGVMIGRYI